MLVIRECNINSYLNQKESKSQSNESNPIEFKKKSKLVDYFDSIYSYPPKIKIKWEGLDELKHDSFIGSNYTKQKSSFPFIDKWFFNKPSEEAVIHNYETSEYFDGFLDKINSSNFFLKKTKKIQEQLSNVPIFVILNGQGEIVLSKPSRILGPKNPINFVKGKLYDSSGAFDSSVEKKSELGMFFMGHSEAERYLKEIARNDVEGTQTLGLSIQCISLESAYKITREFHPGVDFRFVPNFHEVKNLLVNKLGKSDLIFEDEQQQLRFRARKRNLFPYLNKLSSYISPRVSFLQNNEYFKGVPIYIVQLNKTPKNIFLNFGVEKYFHVVGAIDTVCGQLVQYLDKTIGFGHNWIMQGSLQKTKTLDKFENFIFFEKDEAIKFSKKNSRNVIRFKGGRNSSLGNFIRKPKILVYNLEDFIEDWEDKILGEINNGDGIESNTLNNHFNYFIPPSSNLELVNGFSSDKQSFVKNLSQSLSVKFRILKRTVGVIFSVY